MKVLVAVDGSKPSERAFDWYLENVHRPGNEVLVAHFGQQPHLPVMHFRVDGGSYPSDEIKKVTKEANERLQVIKEKFDIKCSNEKVKHSGLFQLVEGSPGEKIVALSETEKCNVIIMGSRGLGTFKRTILGSVSDYVIHHAKIPVLVCPKE